ncbi:hypothetical protein NLU13_7841 [Sarocladium strictum]|uniref:Uncharacterized protein n=1 Tax=Sarocladium strictum TaxID=5046 RepID=A0AA39GDK4_SARSR|nr:hypothetical protein NLU13_7841 [Sarocladium strictum]
MSQSNPPLLLTKRLTSFLHASASPSLPTLLLTTPSGKLLAHASPRPVSTLRTHATVAASLFAIHTSSSVSLPTALPGSAPDDSFHTSDEEDVSGSEDEEEEGARGRDGNGRGRKKKKPEMTKPVTITVQLSGGVVVIKRLKCGLLFVCIGPPIAGSDQHAHPHTTPDLHHPQLTQHLDTSTPPDPHHLAPASANVLVGSPSAESLTSTGGQTNASLESVGAASAAAMRRHAAELARWLDEKLGTLSVPEEGVGIYN